MPANTGTPHPTFEESLNRLEELVETLEDDELNLEDALKAYEEGVGLARACRAHLDDAEMRVQELSLDD